MSAEKKLLARFLKCPADFEWSELVKLLRSVGYEEQAGKGSRRKFVREGAPTIIAHEPHPGRIVKRYLLRQIRELLEREKLI